MSLLTALVAAGHVRAQSVGTGPVFQSYSFDDPVTAGLESFRLTTVPYGVSLPIGRFDVAVLGAWSAGSAKAETGEEAKLSGFTDTDVALTYTVGDWLVVGADATISTGRTTLTTEESLVAGVVAADLLPFTVNTWGSGSGFGANVAMATEAGGWGLGVAGGYRVSGEFEPVPDETLGYNPGDQIQVRAALDRDIAGSSTLSVVVAFQHYSDDQISGTNLFKSGSRIQGLVSLAFPVGLRSGALVYGGVNHRSQGTLLLDESLLAGAGESPSQQLFTGGANLRVPLGRSAALLPVSELRIFRAEDGASQGWVSSVGTSLDLRISGNSASRRLVLSPSGYFRFGNVIVEEGAEVGVTGWEASLVLRLEGGR